MSVHPSEDDLVLHHYGEVPLHAHLADCVVCRERYEALVRVLSAVPDDFGLARGAEYGSEVWDRLQPRLRRSWTTRRVRSLAPWAALAASVAVAFALGRVSREGEIRRAQASIPTPARERILLVAVGEHLERSQMVLVELQHAEGNGVVDISAERQRAQELVAANRLYRHVAQGAGEPGLASVLEELERALVEVVMSADAVTRTELEEIRERMEAQGILFKVRVIGSRVRERSGVPRPTGAGSQT